jgi:hypothetical protein
MGIRTFRTLRDIPLRAIALNIVQCRETGTMTGQIETYTESLASPEWNFNRDDADASPPVVVGPIRRPDPELFKRYESVAELPEAGFGAIAFVNSQAFARSASGQWIMLPDLDEYYLLPDGNHRVSAAVALGWETYPVVKQLSGSYVEALDYASGPANRPSPIIFLALEKGHKLNKVLRKFQTPELLEIWWRQLDTTIAKECGCTAPVVKDARDQFLASQPSERRRQLEIEAQVRLREDGSECATYFRGRKRQGTEQAEDSSDDVLTESPQSPVTTTTPIIQLTNRNYIREPAVKEVNDSGRFAREVRTLLDEFGLVGPAELRDRLIAYKEMEKELARLADELQKSWDENDALQRKIKEPVRMAG